MKRFLLYFFVILFLDTSTAYAQNEPRVKFIKTKVLDEFEVVLSVNVLDSLSLDLDATYLSFVDNNPQSIDCGEYRILYFHDDGTKLYSVFIIENSAPPKFVRLQLVFRDQFNDNFKTKSEEYRLILENNFWVLPKGGVKNIFYVYFNDSNSRNILLLDILSKKVLSFKNILSGAEIDVGNLPRGIYFFSIEDFSTKKIFLR